MNNPAPKLQQLSTADVRAIANDSRASLQEQEAAVEELRRRLESGETYGNENQQRGKSIHPLNAPLHRLVL